MNKTETIVQLAQNVADEREAFFEKRGPGAGDRETNAFMEELRTRVQDSLGIELSEQHICGDNQLAVDFYVPEEATVIEVALSLRNPNSEFERDILKAAMAKDEGHDVRQLVFVSKPGALKRHRAASSVAIRSWVERHHGIKIQIRELSNRHVG